jgi:hypothetical protein
MKGESVRRAVCPNPQHAIRQTGAKIFPATFPSSTRCELDNSRSDSLFEIQTMTPPPAGSAWQARVSLVS